MQGKKNFSPKLFFNFYLPDQIPDDNFYKVLKKHLDLSFIYRETKYIYNHTGRPSLDPVVFFKCLLIGYLENICSDRALEKAIQLRLDLLYFIDHDIGEAPPDHSTICKTRKRIPVDVFEKVFNHVLGLCISAGLVKGDIQSIDTAYINANASLDKIACPAPAGVEVKMIDRDLLDYLNEVKSQDDPSDNDMDQAKKRMKKSQKTLEQFTEQRRKKYSDLEGGKQHKKNKRRFMSNATHMSRTDPDARIAKKSGKPRMLCYSAAVSVDNQQNVITHISAEHASKRDSRLLLDIVESTLNRLEPYGLSVEKVLADAGFSSGHNYYVLDNWGLDSYIPIHGSYKATREHFRYNEKTDNYQCRNGANLKFVSYDLSGGYDKKKYYSSRKDCNTCPFRTDCVDSRGVKMISHTVYKKEYDSMIKKMKSNKGRKIYSKRMQCVEPILGTLQQYYGLRFINVRGKPNAHKAMLMAGAAINLKKWIKKLNMDPFKAICDTRILTVQEMIGFIKRMIFATEHNLMLQLA